MCYKDPLRTSTSLKELVESFLQKGGKINDYYLRDLNRSGPALVYYNGWYQGVNIRSAILKAIAK